MSDSSSRFSATQLIGDTLSHFADLMKSEINLAKAEIAEKLAAKAMAGVWMAVAGVVALIGVMVLVEAAVFAIASYGIALHWSCLIVAAVLLIVSCILFLVGKRNAEETLVPTRSVRQLQRDLATAKEQI